MHVDTLSKRPIKAQLRKRTVGAENVAGIYYDVTVRKVRTIVEHDRHSLCCVGQLMCSLVITLCKPRLLALTAQRNRGTKGTTLLQSPLVGCVVALRETTIKGFYLRLSATNPHVWNFRFRASYNELHKAPARDTADFSDARHVRTYSTLSLETVCYR